MKRIIVETKNVYGQERIYPVCKTARLFTKLAKRETLSAQDLALIRLLGYEIEFSCKVAI